MDKNIEIEKYEKKALDLRKEGYSCSQSVLMALSDIVGLDETLAMRLASGYGSGFAGTGGICGALSILAAAQGLVEDIDGPADKVKAMKATRVLYDRFKEENGGRTLCRELKGKENSRSCHDLVLQAVRIFIEENLHTDIKSDS